jgi:uncharacterized CHY-type Zn-finger protein
MPSSREERTRVTSWKTAKKVHDVRIGLKRREVEQEKEGGGRGSFFIIPFVSPAHVSLLLSPRLFTQVKKQPFLTSNLSPPNSEEGFGLVTLAVRMPDEFPFDVADQRLCFSVRFPEAYPNKPCEIALTNAEVPERLRTKFGAAVRKRWEEAYKASANPAMATGLIRWAKNNAERLFVDKAMTEEHRTGITVIVPTAKGKPCGIEDDPSLFVGAPAPPAKEEEKEKKEDKEKEGEEEEEMVEEEPTAGTIFPTAAAHKGTQLVANNMKMEGVGVVTCTRLALVFACGRCKQYDQAALSPGMQQSLECAKCRAAMLLTFRPDTMHERNAVVGYVDADACRPVEVVPSDFTAACLGCSSSAAFTGLSFATGHPMNCLHCHARLFIFIERIVFTRVQEPRAAAAITTAKKRAPKHPSEAGIHVGSPLPGNGTCKHYKRSFRWLRFPCCGRAFPCDTCHDSEMDHACEWATRMLCGFCSKEQPFSKDKPCVACGASFDGSGRSHWEGGQGCRDPTKMSRKDTHKFAGTAKTKSASKGARK